MSGKLSASERIALRREKMKATIEQTTAVTKQRFDLGSESIEKAISGEDCPVFMAPIASIKPAQKDINNCDTNNDEFNVNVSVDLLKSNPFNARYFYNDKVITELSRSLVENGQKIPIIITVDSKNPGSYIIIDGEFRFRAAKLAGIEFLRCDIYRDVTNEELYHLSNMVNGERTPQTVFDNAKSWAKLLQSNMFSEQQKLADFLGTDKATLSKVLSINEIPDKYVSILLSNSNASSRNLAYELVQIYKLVEESEFETIVLNLVSEKINKNDLVRIRKNITNPKQRVHVLPSSITTFEKNGKKYGTIKYNRGKLMLDVSVLEESVAEKIIKEIEKTIKDNLLL